MHVAGSKIFVELARLIRFGSVGILATASYGVVTIVMMQAGVGGPLFAAIIGNIAAVAVSYFGHLYYSFQVEARHSIFLWRFVVIAVVTFGVNLLCTWFVVERLHWSQLVAVMLMVLLLPGISYLGSRLWVFLPGLRSPVPDSLSKSRSRGDER